MDRIEPFRTFFAILIAARAEPPIREGGVIAAFASHRQWLVLETLPASRS